MGSWTWSCKNSCDLWFLKSQQHSGKQIFFLLSPLSTKKNVLLCVLRCSNNTGSALEELRFCDLSEISLLCSLTDRVDYCIGLSVQVFKLYPNISGPQHQELIAQFGFIETKLLLHSKIAIVANFDGRKQLLAKNTPVIFFHVLPYYHDLVFKLYGLPRKPVSKLILVLTSSKLSSVLLSLGCLDLCLTKKPEGAFLVLSLLSLPLLLSLLLLLLSDMWSILLKLTGGLSLSTSTEITVSKEKTSAASVFSLLSLFVPISVWKNQQC